MSLEQFSKMVLKNVRQVWQWGITMPPIMICSHRQRRPTCWEASSDDKLRAVTRRNYCPNYSCCSISLGTTLFPFDRTRRLAGDVIDHSVDALYVIDNPGSDAAQEFMLIRIIIRGHTIS